MTRHRLTSATPITDQAVRGIVDRMVRASGARERYLELSHGTVHLLEQGHGPPLLHLHGSTTSALSHLPLLERMPTVRSIAVDRPGFGLSDPRDLVQEDYRQGVVGFLDEVLDALSLPVAALAGGSMGGTWALWYAIDRPHRVSRVALLGATPLLPGTRVPIPLRLRTVPPLDDLLNALVPPSTANVVRFMSIMGEGDTITHHPDLLASLVAGARHPTARLTDRAELTALINLAGFRPAMRLRREELQALSTPTLMVWGDRDPLGGAEVARASARLFGDVRLELLPAGHVPWLGHPDRVADLLMTFVACPSQGPADGASARWPQA